MQTEQLKHVVLGTGPLGIAVIETLAAQGKRAVAVNRSGKADLPAGVEILAVDLYTPEGAQEAIRGSDVVYQCAQPPYHRWLDLFLPLQRNIVWACEAAGARLVAGDNLYMYGDVDGPLSEDLPYRATTRKGQLRAQMAEELMEAHAAGRVQVAIARGSDFYGPHVLGSTMGERVFVPLLQGKAASITGNPDLPHTYTYIRDFGRAMVVLAQDDGSYGETWHVPNPPTLTQRELVELAFDLVGREPEIKSMGVWMMRLGGLFIPEARESVEMMYEFEKPFIVDSSKFERHFEMVATPHLEALIETLNWYRDDLIQQGEQIAVTVNDQAQKEALPTE